MSKAIDQLNQNTKLKNAAFLALKPAQRRIQIARDVIAQIGGRITARAGTYFDTRDLRNINISDEAQAQTVFKKITSCTVCAIGSLFLCGVDRANAVTVGQIELGGGSVDGSDAKRYLRKFFSIRQLALIETAFETAFEKTYIGPSRFQYSDEAEAATKFGRTADELTDSFNNAVSYMDEIEADDNRMRLIMQNIIANNGTFRPSKLPSLQIVTPGF